MNDEEKRSVGRPRGNRMKRELMISPETDEMINRLASQLRLSRSSLIEKAVRYYDPKEPDSARPNNAMNQPGLHIEFDVEGTSYQFIIQIVRK